MLLDHLKKLTIELPPGVTGPAVYAKPDEGLGYQTVSADDEGAVCVDDTARSVILALEYYKKYGDSSALDLAKQWIEFVKYMTNRLGKVANFMYEDGTINEMGPTSQRGNQWWQARAMWAYSRMYEVTSDTSYLDLYWKVKRHLKPSDPRVVAIETIVTCEMWLQNIQQPLTPVSYNTFFRMGETFGYHQLQAGFLLQKIGKGTGILPDRAIVEYIKPMVDDRFWTEWKSQSKDGLCAYNVSPIVQGLAVTNRYDDLLEKSINWFTGGWNDINRIMYDPETGICFDGLYSENAGAESSIEAGLAYLSVNHGD